MQSLPAANFAMYTPKIDLDIPPADFSPTFQDLEERVSVAINALFDTDSLPPPDEISEADKDEARAIFTGRDLATDENLSSPGVVVYLQSLLSEYDKTVVKSAAQLRTYVTNKLLLETDNADPRIRMRSLELLGKISDVGLFTDKTEITMRHRPTEELEQLLRERLTRVIEGDHVVKAQAKEIQTTVEDVNPTDGPE